MLAYTRRNGGWRGRSMGPGLGVWGPGFCQWG